MAMLRWSMAHRAAIVTISVLVIASIVPLFMVIGRDFAPTDDRSEFQVGVKTPEGSGLAATLTVLERIAADLRAFPEVTDTLVTVGGGGGGGGPMGGGRIGGVVNTGDRKSTRLNSSHITISYAVFCVKKKKIPEMDP